MRIVILTSETPANIWLVNQLLARHEVAGMVIERRPLALAREEKYERRRRMVQRYGLARAFNKLLYNSVRSRFLAHSEGAMVREHFFPGGAPIRYTRQVPTLTVENINDAACIEFIRSQAPDVLAVCGTSILRLEVFVLPPKGTVNIHTGITPEYRSADPIFWALYRADPDKVGVTIHFVDRGIDTGPIIHQESIPVYASDSLATIYVRCIRRGAELYTRALTEIANGSVCTLHGSRAIGQSFRSIDLGIVQYLLFLARFRWLARRLPREPVESEITR
ncbi:MAG: formyl transferase [bacterium]